MEREFIPPDSIVRTIWADPDMVLLIFAGSAAEFALNRAVDWLFVTGSLPKDPIGRLFSTVHYAQRILFADAEDARNTMDSISAVHAAIERKRGERIPDCAHRDVLYMLIDHSQRAFRLLHRPLTRQEQCDLYAAFLQLGRGLGIPQLPATFTEWEEDRTKHLERDLAYSDFTKYLFERYRARLGAWRYWLLLEIQALLVAGRVRELLRLNPNPLLAGSSAQIYAMVRQLGLRPLIQHALIPRQYWGEMRKLKRTAALEQGPRSSAG